LECRIKEYYRTEKNSCPARTLFLLLSLFASTAFTPSEYLECDSLFPDENLDLLGIAKVSQNLFPPARVSDFTASVLTPLNFGSRHPFFEVFSGQPSNFQIELTTILRC
jgi:hypothetical protein